MTAKPTRRQWRGYAVLCVVLAAAVVVLLFWPAAEREPAAADHSQLKEAIEQYGDSIVEGVAAERHHRYGRRPDTARWERREYSGHNAGQHQSRREEYYRSIRVELNSADTAELQLLYGIGPAFAARIVKYRQKLGGFVRKEQLLEVYGMDSVRYAGIAANVTVDSSLVTAIDINRAGVAELKRHPYLDYYQAKSIVDYRAKGNRYSKMDDLLLVSLMDEATVRKLQGYIQFN